MLSHTQYSFNEVACKTLELLLLSKHSPVPLLIKPLELCANSKVVLNVLSGYLFPITYAATPPQNESLSSETTRETFPTEPQKLLPRSTTLVKLI